MLLLLVRQVFLAGVLSMYFSTAIIYLHFHDIYKVKENLFTRRDLLCSGVPTDKDQIQTQIFFWKDKWSKLPVGCTFL